MARCFLVFFLAFFIACMPSRYPENRPPETYTSHRRDREWNTLLIPTWVDADFAPPLRDSVTMALQEWNLVLNGKFRFEVQPNDAEREKRQDRGELSLWVRQEKLPDDHPGVLGWYDPDEPGAVHIIGDQVGVSSSDMKTVIEHEIGHWFGLGHIKVKWTLMYPYWTEQIGCIDRRTVTVLAALHGWDDRNLNWCEP